MTLRVYETSRQRLVSFMLIGELAVLEQKQATLVQLILLRPRASKIAKGGMQKNSSTAGTCHGSSFRRQLLGINDCGFGLKDG